MTELELEERLKRLETKIINVYSTSPECGEKMQALGSLAIAYTIYYATTRMEVSVRHIEGRIQEFNNIWSRK